MTSLQHNGVELAAPGQAAGQFESGWSSATVTSRKLNFGRAILITAANPSIGVTQYYFARKGDNTIYLATNIEAAEPSRAVTSSDSPMDRRRRSSTAPNGSSPSSPSGPAV